MKHTTPGAIHINHMGYLSVFPINISASTQLPHLKSGFLHVNAVRRVSGTGGGGAGLTYEVRGPKSRWNIDSNISQSKLTFFNTIPIS